MPNSRRWAIKRDFDQIIARAEKSRDELVGLANLYLDEHPDYAAIMFKLADYQNQFVVETNKVRDII